MLRCLGQHGRAPGEPQPLQQVGVLIPDDERRGRRTHPARARTRPPPPRVMAKHQAGKSKRIGPSTVRGKATAAPASRAARSGGHQPGSGSTSSFMTTTYGVRAARSPALTGEAKPCGGLPLSTMHDLVRRVGGRLHGGDAGADALGGGVERGDDDGQLGRFVRRRRRAPPVRAPGACDDARPAPWWTLRPRLARRQAHSAPMTSASGTSGIPIGVQVARRARPPTRRRPGRCGGSRRSRWRPARRADQRGRRHRGASQPGAGTAASRRMTTIIWPPHARPRRAAAADRPPRRSLRITRRRRPAGRAAARGRPRRRRRR